MVLVALSSAFAAKRSLGKALPCLARHIHVLPTLTNINADQGIPGLLSRDAFNIAWTNRQSDLISKLNELVVDTDNETRAPFHIIVAADMRSQDARVFNYASQIFNNHLFFSSLRADGPLQSETAPTGISKALEKRIVAQYASLAGLREEFFKAAKAIESQGWVFLSELPNKKLAVSAHHNAGSPFSLSRSQTTDLIGVVSETTLRDQEQLAERVKADEKNYNIALLALNLWQDVYVPDYGIAGREKYIEQWWKSIDWSQVSKRLYRSSHT